MKDLLIEELGDIYDAENQALKAYPKFIKATTSDQFRQALEAHRMQTEEQVQRLKEAFDLLGAPARGQHCDAMAGLLTEANGLIDEGLPPALLDVALIAAVQKMEHYEIAAYGAVHAYADAMGNTEVASLLEETLTEEKETDALLTRIAIEDVNRKAIGKAA
jgi:ferritin-like metal-binding protein YciE